MAVVEGVTEATAKVFTTVNSKADAGPACAKLFAVIIVMR